MGRPRSPRSTLAVAAAQPPTVPYDVGANAVHHASLIRAAGGRVVVFPELSLTGYHLDAPVVAPDDERLAPIVEACLAVRAVALVGAPVADRDGDHIGVLAIDGSGASVAYRKMWLGGSEPDRFNPGPEPAMVEVDGWRLGLAVCKDTGVPEHAAATAELGVHAYVAGVLDDAEDLPVQEQRARRIAADHGTWVVMASFAGSTGGGYERAAGRSRIWSPEGVVVAEAGAEPGAVVRAMLTTAGQEAAHDARSRLR